MNEERLPEVPPHPYWCDDCGQRAPFTIPGCAIEHATDCPRAGEDPMAVYDAAADYCLDNGGVIR